MGCEGLVMTTFHIDVNGNLLRATSDPDVIIPNAVTTTLIAPISGKAKWNGAGWDEPVIDLGDTMLNIEDIERLLRALGATPVQVRQAKRDRGKPMP
jgi:hypothetical protein